MTFETNLNGIFLCFFPKIEFLLSFLQHTAPSNSFFNFRLWTHENLRRQHPPPSKFSKIANVKKAVPILKLLSSVLRKFLKNSQKKSLFRHETDSKIRNVSDLLFYPEKSLKFIRKFVHFEFRIISERRIERISDICHSPGIKWLREIKALNHGEFSGQNQRIKFIRLRKCRQIRLKRRPQGRRDSMFNKIWTPKRSSLERLGLKTGYATEPGIKAKIS